MDNQLTLERFDLIEADYQSQLENSTEYPIMLRLQGALMAIRVLREYVYPPLVLETAEQVGE